MKALFKFVFHFVYFILRLCELRTLATYQLINWQTLGNSKNDLDDKSMIHYAVG